MKKMIILLLCFCSAVSAMAQTAEELVQQVRARLEKVKDYEAKGKLKTNVTFIKAPVASIRVYFKNPDKLKIINESGISFIPKGSVNINLNSVLARGTGYDILDGGTDKATGWRVIKLLPADEKSDIVLSTLYIDESQQVIRKAKNTTRESGTYELDMEYGRYAEWGLPDKVVFTFNTREYKLPKGVTFDYDGGKKKPAEDKLKNQKGKVEISYSSYTINKGVDDGVFN